MAADVPANSIAAPARAVAAVTLAAADYSSKSHPGSIPTLFVAVIGALALASITVSLFFQFGRARHPRRGVVRARRGPVWESTDDDRIVLSDYPEADVIPSRPRFARNIPSSPDHRMADFLSRMTGRAPT
ncbi:MAG: hypothetical protein ACXWKP_24640 [Bradyrhizobium sp.]